MSKEEKARQGYVHGVAEAMASVERFLGMSPAGPLTEKCRVVNLVGRLQILLRGSLPDFLRGLGAQPPARRCTPDGGLVDKDALARWLSEWRRLRLSGSPLRPNPGQVVRHMAGY